MNYKDLPNHHALLLIDNNRKERGELLFKELASLSLAHRFFDKIIFDIHDARNVITWAQTPHNEARTALISFHTAGLEAQNALLKILEEPRENVRFIILTSNKDHLIETVLSRLYHVQENQVKENTDNAEIYLRTKESERMKLPYIVDILSRTEKEETNNGKEIKERKDKESVKLFILSLATVLEKKGIDPKYREEVIEIASYVADSSSSSKALIEYLSLLLPVVK